VHFHAIGAVGPVGYTGQPGPIGATGGTGAAGNIGGTGATGPRGHTVLKKCFLNFSLILTDFDDIFYSSQKIA
jgi:hypothetical protein